MCPYTYASSKYKLIWLIFSKVSCLGARVHARTAETSYNRSFYPGPECFRFEPCPARLCASCPAQLRPASAQGGHQGKSGMSWLLGRTMVLLWDGNSEHGSHEWSENNCLKISNCRFQSTRSMATIFKLPYSLGTTALLPFGLWIFFI